MSSNRIANRITDLLKLAGFTDKQTIEELKDHFLTHIEEEVKRGLNAQQAVRETYQEIAHLDSSEFELSKGKRNKKLLFALFILALGIAALIYLSFFGATDPKPVIAEDIQNINLNQRVHQPPTGFPIDKSFLDITSEFGLRRHPILKTTHLHTGIDIKAKTGTPVLAAAGGIVLEASTAEKPGNYIILQHESGYKTKYFHLSDWNVTEGQEVEKGQQIGKVGNTGMSFLSHLHYELLKDEVHVNPKNYIKP